MKRTLLVTLALFTLAVPLAACTSQTPGQANESTAGGGSAEDPFPSTGGQKTTSPPPSSSAGSNPLANTPACEVLSDTDVTALGLEPGTERNSSSSTRECRYKKGVASLSVTIYSELGVKDVSGRGELKTITVGKHEAVQGISAAGVCAIAIKLTDSSRVDASGTQAGNDEISCQLANSLAQAVEKNLP